MDGDHVGEMPVLVLRIVNILRPFLKLAPLADFRPEQANANRFDFFPEILIHSEGLGGFDGVGEKVVGELLVVGISGGDGAVLGRCAGRSDEFAIGVFLEDVFPKFAEFLEDRIDAGAEVFFVAGEGVVVPEVLGEPGPVAHAPAGSGAAEDAVFPTSRPTAHAVGALRVLAAHGNDRVKPFAVGLEALAKIGCIHEPVVHLEVDVRVVIGAPRRIVAIVPDALEVGGQIAGARATDHQVARELENERLEFGIRRAFSLGGIGLAVIADAFGRSLLPSPVSSQPPVSGELEDSLWSFS